jgi:octopine oxidase subunit B
MASDVIVVGGGMVGAAIAYGLARAGAKVAVLDDGDTAYRAARGNFGLTWVQSKGLGAQPYFLLSRGSVDGWSDFAAELTGRTGIDLAFRRDGGLTLCLGEAEAEKRKRFIDQFRQQAGNEVYDCRFISREETQALFPKVRLGPTVVGAAFSPMDGYTNPLLLLRALTSGLIAQGGAVHAGHPVRQIGRSGSGYEVITAAGRFHADKVVIAAGLGTEALARMVGLDVPVRPQRGQVLVTERTEEIFAYPMSGLRQTAEGTVMIGLTNEDVGFDTDTTIPALGSMIDRAIASFPVLGQLKLMRAWAALRVLTPDGRPVYAESPSHPGIYVATCHSGVTLAAMHASVIPRWVLDGRMPAALTTFNPGRFDVQPAA